jgi:hypothetical protein
MSNFDITGNGSNGTENSAKVSRVVNSSGSSRIKRNLADVVAFLDPSNYPKNFSQFTSRDFVFFDEEIENLQWWRSFIGFARAVLSMGQEFSDVNNAALVVNRGDQAECTATDIEHNHLTFIWKGYLIGGPERTFYIRESFSRPQGGLRSANGEWMMQRVNGS